MSPIRWVPTELEPRRMIAVTTLDAVRALLRAQAAGREPHPPVEGTVTVRVAEHPPLGLVGGVARVDDGTRGVAIARISSSTFVAYQLEAQGLRELPVEVDGATGSLRVRRDGAT